jgi:hypothetical protein
MSIARYSRADAPQGSAFVARDPLDSEASTFPIANTLEEVPHVPRRLHAGRVKGRPQLPVHGTMREHVARGERT